MNEEIHEADLIIHETNALFTSEADRLALISALQPIAAKMPEAVKLADEISVTNAAQAEQAALLMDSWQTSARDAEKLIRDFGGGLLENLFRIHRKGTALIGRFQVFTEAAKKVKRKILDWHEAEADAAWKKQAEIQAKLDAEAETERQRKLKAAENLKTPELKEQRIAEAQRIVAPIANVPVPEKVVSSRKVWKVTQFDLGAFIDAAADRPNNLCGYFKIKTENGRFISATISGEDLAASKSRNTMLEIPGVTFTRISV